MKESNKLFMVIVIIITTIMNILINEPWIYFFEGSMALLFIADVILREIKEIFKK